LRRGAGEGRRCGVERGLRAIENARSEYGGIIKMVEKRKSGLFKVNLTNDRL